MSRILGITEDEVTVIKSIIIIEKIEELIFSEQQR
jgi:hypothetical protein